MNFKTFIFAGIAATFHTVLLLSVAGFTATERVVSNPAMQMPDVEFDTLAFRITWQDNLGNLWVTDIDSLTGDFDLAGAILVDSALPPIPSYKAGTGSGDGPEWIFRSGGEDILYTKANGLPQANWMVYRAALNNGVWLGAAIPAVDQLSYGPYGDAPNGSITPNDPTPRLSFFVPPANPQTSVLAWRKLNKPTGTVITDFATSGGRWASYNSALVAYTRRVNGIDQGFIYDTIHLTETQVTFSSSDKSDQGLWLDPYSNQPLFSVTQTLADVPTTIGIYQQDSRGKWQLINTIRPPTTLANLRLARPATYNGESYISMIAEDSKGTASEIWLAGVRADIPFYRQVSVPTVLMVRNDPEFVALNSGAFVYFTDSWKSIVYQCPTGLGPPASKIIRGTSKADTLRGNANDLITGGGGADQLTGGTGDDQFAYESVSDGGDTIKNFQVGHDLIVMNLLMAHLGYTGPDPIQDGYLIFSTSKSGSDTQIYLDPDGSAGPAAPALYLTIKNVPPTVMNSTSNFVF